MAKYHVQDYRGNFLTTIAYVLVAPNGQQVTTIGIGTRGLTTHEKSRLRKRLEKAADALNAVHELDNSL